MRICLDKPIAQDPAEEQLARELAKIEARENPKPRVSVAAHRPELSSPAHVPQKYAIPTLRENEERDGYEIRFPEKPAPEITKELSLNGWRFNPDRWVSPRWWRKRCPESLAFARHLIARLNGADMIGIRDGTCSGPPSVEPVTEIILKPSQRIMQLLKL